MQFSQRVFRRFLIWVSGLGLLSATPAFAQNLEINLAQHSAQFKYSTAVGGSNYGRSEMYIGGLYNDDKRAAVSELALLVVDNAGSKTPGLTMGLGPKVWVAKRGDYSAVAIAIGADFKYKLGMDDRLFTRAHAFYAPSIVSFGDANKMYELSLTLGYEMLPTADAYFGYRTIKADFPLDSDRILDNSLFFGIRIAF